MRITRFPLLLSTLLLCLTLPPMAFPQIFGTPGKSEDQSKITLPTTPSETEPEDEPGYVPPYEEPVVPDPIFIQGTVIREDGSAPPFGTVIERDCGDIVVKEVLVNSNGFFSFQIGDHDRAGGLMVDASQNFFSDRGSTADSEYETSRVRGRIRKDNYPEYLVGCVLEAKYAGYHSTYARLGVEQKTGLIEVGTIIMYPISRKTGTVISASNLKAPKSAREALKSGKKAFERDAYDEAEQFFRSALNIYPNYTDAWIELGWLYQKQENYGEAEKAYSKASEIDELYVNPYIRLAQLTAIEQKWEKSIQFSEKALSLDPVTFPEAFYLKSLAHYNLDQLEAAEEILHRGIRIDLQNRIPRMYLLLANIHARKQAHAESIEAMRQYLEADPDAPDAESVRELVKEYKKIAEDLNKRETGKASNTVSP